MNLISSKEKVKYKYFKAKILFMKNNKIIINLLNSALQGLMLSKII